MQEGNYLIVDPACEVNERGTRDKNDGNEVVDNCDLPLDLELTTEPVEVDDETLLYAEEDWDCPEQTEIDKGVQPDFPFTMETRQSKEGRNKKKYKPYGEDFVIDRIVLSIMMESLVGLDEVAVPQEIDLVNDMDQDCFDDRSEPEVEFEPEVEQTHEQELTKLRVLEWLHDLPADPKQTILTIQDVDKDGIKNVSYDNTESNWVALDGPLRVPESNLDLLDFGRSTGTSMEVFVRGVGVGLIQQSPPTTISQQVPTTPMSSQTNQPQPSTRISWDENSYTFEERHKLLSEPLIPVVLHAPLSKPLYEPTYNIYLSFQRDLNRPRHPSQNQNQTSTKDRQIIHPRRNRNFTTPRVHFNIPSSSSPNPLDLSIITVQSTPHHYNQFYNKVVSTYHRIT